MANYHTHTGNLVNLPFFATGRRWERDRRRLLDEDVDRARDFAGLKRAVEAQSQLVMETLVAAQRYTPDCDVSVHFYCTLYIKGITAV